MREVVVAGVGMCRFFRYDGQKGRPKKTSYELGAEAVMAALKDAGIEWRRIEAAFFGNCYEGVASGHRVVGQIGFTGIPVINVENACSSGLSAFRLGYQAVATGLHDICLAVGFEQVPGGFIASTGWPEWQRFMGFNVQPAAYALETIRYMKDHEVTEQQLAQVTVQNRKHATMNPYAYFQQEVTIEEVLDSRMIAGPLRLLMCCPNADGAAAAILVSRDKLKPQRRKVAVAAAVLATSMHGEERGGGSVLVHNPNRTEIAAKQAYEVSGYGPQDMDVAEVYDAMAPTQLLSIERLGICPKGEAAHLLQEGVFSIGGKLPINTSGGLLGRGHPLGATGLAQVCEVVWQLRGEAGRRQVDGAKIGLCHTLGAGPNCAIGILKT